MTAVTQPLDPPRRKSYMLPTCAALVVIAGAYIDVHLRRGQLIISIYTALNKDNNQQLDSTEIQPLKKQGIAVPATTTLDGLATALQNISVSDLQKLLENVQQ